MLLAPCTVEYVEAGHGREPPVAFIHCMAMGTTEGGGDQALTWVPGLPI